MKRLAEVLQSSAGVWRKPFPFSITSSSTVRYSYCGAEYRIL